MTSHGKPRMSYTASQICWKHNVVHNEGSDAERRCQEAQRQTPISTSSPIPAIAEEPERDDSHLPAWARAKVVKGAS